MVGIRAFNRSRSLSIPARQITFMMDRFKVAAYGTFFVWNVFTEKCVLEAFQDPETLNQHDLAFTPFMEAPDIRVPFEFDVLEIMNSAFLTPIGERFDFDLDTQILYFDYMIGILQPWTRISYSNLGP